MKLNDYVRTDRGTIFKVENITEIDIDGQWFKSKTKENSVIKDLPRFMYDETDEYIIKSSPNIIDLIQEGDYVNGLKVSRVDGTYHGRKDKAIYCDYCENKETGKWTMIYDDEIKSIVTKEQFKSMEYEVE